MLPARFVRPTLAGVLLAVPFAVLLGAPPVPPKLPVKDFSKATACKVLRIVDGDTIVVQLNGKATKVRLIGVDTPETVHPRKPVQFYGKEASQFTTSLLTGRSVYLEYKPDERTDRYGRTLAYVYRAPDGLFVNLEIIRQGYGHVYTKYPFEHMELFRHYERIARENRKGLWGGAAPAKDPKSTTGGTAPAKDPKDITVYVTRTGKKYHREGVTPWRRARFRLS
jgi:micrococcal nuclease